MSFFAQKIKQLRKKNMLSQAALAKQLDITQQAVGKWETDKCLPDTSMLQKLAEMFDVSIDSLLGHESGVEANVSMVPILGTVKAGYNAFASQENYGKEPAGVRDVENYFYLIVRGDSMEPRICAGDLALVRAQTNIDDGDLAVVLVDGDEATLKSVQMDGKVLTLKAFNPEYPDRVFSGREKSRLKILGKVVETKAKW